MLAPAPSRPSLRAGPAVHGLTVQGCSGVMRRPLESIVGIDVQALVCQSAQTHADAYCTARQTRTCATTMVIHTSCRDTDAITVTYYSSTCTTVAPIINWRCTRVPSSSTISSHLTIYPLFVREAVGTLPLFVREAVLLDDELVVVGSWRE